MKAPPTFDDAHSHAARALDLDFRRACARLQVDEPWFGAFGLIENERGTRHDYRLGKRRSLELRILPWQHPYARAFYECQPGAPVVVDADESLGFRPLDGVLDSKARVVARQRRLERVELERRDGASTWLRRGDTLVDEAEGFRDAMARHGLPDVLALLTTEQYRLITASRARPVVLQGRAGSGKTTVALHRVSWLTHPDAAADTAPVDPSHVLVVMFNRALSAFVETSLGPLGLGAVRLNTFHGWAWEAVTAAYAGRLELKPGPSEGHDVVAGLKKQLGMLPALEAYVARQTATLIAWFTEESAKAGDTTWAKLLRNGDGPIIGRLADVRRRLTQARDAARGKERQRLDELLAVLQRARRKMTLYKEDLRRLLLDRELLGQHLEATEAELDVLEAYQRTLQGDARSPGPDIAFEDLALLLRLIQLKHGGLAAKDADDVLLFDHLVIDEAQDFGAVELKTLLAAVRSRTGVTVVGDLNQKIIPEADFVGWDALAEELGLGGAQVARLEVAHRSSRPIVELAGSIIPDGVPTGGPGPRPTLTVVAEGGTEARGATGALDASIAAQAEAMLGELPGAHVAVVYGNREQAWEARTRLAALLPEQDVRIGHNKEFAFSAGVTVTNVRQVKGLEFDGVILVEPSAQVFPDSEQGRRWLYTVVTRAKRFLAMVATGGDSVTRLVEPARREGLLEIAGPAAATGPRGDGMPL